MAAAGGGTLELDEQPGQLRCLASANPHGKTLFAFLGRLPPACGANGHD